MGQHRVIISLKQLTTKLESIRLNPWPFCSFMWQMRAAGLNIEMRNDSDEGQGSEKPTLNKPWSVKLPQQPEAKRQITSGDL